MNIKKSVGTFIDKIELRLLPIEIISLLITVVFFGTIQAIVIYTDFFSNFPEFLHNFYHYILETDILKLLQIIDGFAVIVDAIAFFLNNWAEKDTENIIFLFVIIGAVVSSCVCKMCDLPIISFALVIFSALFILVSFVFLIRDNLKSSERRTRRRNTSKLSRRITHGKNKRQR